MAQSYAEVVFARSATDVKNLLTVLFCNQDLFPPDVQAAAAHQQPQYDISDEEDDDDDIDDDLGPPSGLSKRDNTMMTSSSDKSRGNSTSESAPDTSLYGALGLDDSDDDSD